MSATARDNGGDDALDEQRDADAGTGWRTPPLAIIADTIDRTLDLGLRMGANVWAQKTGPATAVTGSQFDYTLTFGNNGASTADAVVLADTLPAGLTFVSATPAPSGVVGQALSWSLGSLPPTGTAPAGIITVRVQVDANAPAAPEQPRQHQHMNPQRRALRATTRAP